MCTIDRLDIYFVKKKGKKESFLEFGSETNMLILEALWPIKVLKITLELLLLFLTDLNLSLIMNWQNEKAEKVMTAILTVVSVLLCMSHCSSGKQDEERGMAENWPRVLE